MQPVHFALAADAVLALHVALVLFVITVPLLLPVGLRLGWRWARRRRVRIAHLLVLGIVVLEAWAGWLCPLTDWEMALRARAGGVTYEGDFIAHWLGELLYVRAPPWAFSVAYSAFLALVLWVNLRHPPEGGWRRRGVGHG
ncbi:DUF2784 family protein [Pseudomarimonas salicorniae]|uniref:DUF2784 domain-containing protein n=1 Tax=Pseudomarimonas salicorniae TaxID=2933270 RepID=A0ABT0GKM2_9GAMM|nr:DUF2784 domain-containing protein [Lysobacter sp. CAU 1642]